MALAAQLEGHIPKDGGAMQGVQESRAREASVKVVTLQVETITPRRCTLAASYNRQCTPDGELPADWQNRAQSAESSARRRAMCRLQPDRHKQQLADRKRKCDAARAAAPKARRAEHVYVGCPMDSDSQRAEVERQLRELSAAAAVEALAQQEAKRRREEEAARLVRIFDTYIQYATLGVWYAGTKCRREYIPKPQQSQPE